MITIDTLKKLLKNWDEIIQTSKKFGYENLKLFKARYEEDKDKLHILASYNPQLYQITEIKDTINPLEEALSSLLECPVEFWPEDAEGIHLDDIEEAMRAPFHDKEKVVSYFVEVISYSKDVEPTEEDYKQAKLLLEEYSSASTAINQNLFFNAPPTFVKNFNLSTNVKRLLDETCESLSSEEEWAAAQEYLKSKKPHHSNSSHVQPVTCSQKTPPL